MISDRDPQADDENNCGQAGERCFGPGEVLLTEPGQFCIGMSFLLTALRERTASLLPVAAAHGIFNALAPLLFILAPHNDRILTGPLGVLGALLILLVGALLWIATRRAATTAVREEASVSPSGI